MPAAASPSFACRLEARDLEVWRGERRLFRDLSFAVSGGNALHVRGANGSGKTTLLRVLAGLTHPEHGEVLWNGISVRAPEARADFCFVGHANGIKAGLTPRENLYAAQYLHGKNTNGADVDEALNFFGLEDTADRATYLLSAGQRRRTALARLAATQARLWLLDEPFTSLDAAGIASLVRLLESHCRRGGTLIVTSHQPFELEDVEVAVLDLDAGR